MSILVAVLAGVMVAMTMLIITACFYYLYSRYWIQQRDTSE